ncbi:MAG: peptidoglycan DD-metalloendopeptidase family protein [Gemmatimonadetes bacterium]|nr:peptidoglycan DD-metalloendopeptidase family protein [Gemmatimonadota bacterium]
MVGLLLLLAGCDVPDQIQEVFRDPTSHERYAASLAQAGLDSTAAGGDWIGEGRRALAAPLAVDLPHREDGYLDPVTPTALGYRFPLRRGQRLRLDLVRDEVRPGRLFVDLFRIPGDSTSELFHELDLPPDSSTLEFDAPRTGDYLLRVQPELLRGGAFALELRVLPTLAFPVEGRDQGAILSRFGAERDGGRRQHRGVDIFAPRGTPVLAAEAGRVTRVDTTNLGGYVVWMTEERGGHRLYYAHLDRQLVTEGQRVRPGDTLGLVGNTGNARTTPPHLHFGVYRRGEGALDPYWFVEPQRTNVTPADSLARSLVGAWARARVDDVVVRASPSTRGETIERVERGAALQVLAASETFYRVRMPDGREGYAPQRSLQPATDALVMLASEPGIPIRVLPSDEAPLRRRVTDGESLPVVGLFERYGLVLDERGAEGWVPMAGS